MRKLTETAEEKRARRLEKKVCRQLLISSVCVERAVYVESSNLTAL